jgi:uncharacterized membrane protein YcaP (DUF421 family)
MMLFHSWSSTFEVAVRTAVAYVAVVAALRVTGEQVLAKMTAYDLIVSITLGSVLAQIPFSSDVAIIDGIVILITFIALQEVIRWLQARSPRIRSFVIEEPRLVVWNGRLLEDRIERWRLTVPEVRAAIRRAGLAGVSEVKAAVLENDGEWSIVRRRDCGTDYSAFEALDIPKSE